MIGRWAGDRILVQGDYAEQGDQSYMPEQELESFTDISANVKDMLDKVMID